MNGRDVLACKKGMKFVTFMYMKTAAAKKKTTIKKPSARKKTKTARKGVGMDVILKAVAYAKKHPIEFVGE